MSCVFSCPLRAMAFSRRAAGQTRCRRESRAAPATALLGGLRPGARPPPTPRVPPPRTPASARAPRAHPWPEGPASGGRPHARLAATCAGLHRRRPEPRPPGPPVPRSRGRPLGPVWAPPVPLAPGPFPGSVSASAGAPSAPAPSPPGLRGVPRSASRLRARLWPGGWERLGTGAQRPLVKKSRAARGPHGPPPVPSGLPAPQVVPRAVPGAAACPPPARARPPAGSPPPRCLCPGAAASSPAVLCAPTPPRCQTHGGSAARTTRAKQVRRGRPRPRVPVPASPSPRPRPRVPVPVDARREGDTAPGPA